jgi:hypothetical protein
MIALNAQQKLRREIAGTLLFVAIGMAVEVFVTGLPCLDHRSSGLGRVSGELR